jgi:hypothetical protein
MGMVYTLVEAAKDWLTDHSSSMHDKMLQRLTSERMRMHDAEEELACRISYSIGCFVVCC